MTFICVFSACHHNTSTNIIIIIYMYHFWCLEKVLGFVYIFAAAFPRPFRRLCFIHLLFPGHQYQPVVCPPLHENSEADHYVVANLRSQIFIQAKLNKIHLTLRSRIFLLFFFLSRLFSYFLSHFDFLSLNNSSLPLITFFLLLFERCFWCLGHLISFTCFQLLFPLFVFLFRHFYFIFSGLCVFIQLFLDHCLQG